MILDHKGRPIADAGTPENLHSGRFTFPDFADRSDSDPSVALTPRRVREIMEQADSGDAADQARLVRAILEKNFEISAAWNVRLEAVLGLKWHVEPGADGASAKDAAERFDVALRAAGASPDSVSLAGLLPALMLAKLTGYAAAEILWGSGGSLKGFALIPPENLSFQTSFSPRLRVTGDVDQDLPYGKYLTAAPGLHGPDPVRGGLIRPLAWLHCFVQLELKDLLSFTERYGMPMIVAKISSDAYEKERRELIRMIRKFGANGGGVVTQSTEISPIQPGNVQGDVYFRILEFFKDTTHRLILGQTAASGDGGGLSGDTAQSRVRQDIMESDAAFLADVINRQLAPVWTAYNRGPAPVPRLAFDVGAPEDTKSLAETVKTLFDAGFQADAAELSDRFGLKLTQVGQVGQVGQGGQGRGGGPDAETLNLKQKYDAIGVAIRGGFLTATPEIEAQTRAELGLPDMSPEARKAWDATGGIRQPITLKTAEAEAVNDALNVDEKTPVGQGRGGGQMAETPPASREIGFFTRAASARYQTWADTLAALAADDSLPDDEFRARLAALAEGDNFDDSDEFEIMMYNAMAAGLAAGRKDKK